MHLRARRLCSHALPARPEMAVAAVRGNPLDGCELKGAEGQLGVRPSVRPVRSSARGGRQGASGEATDTARPRGPHAMLEPAIAEEAAGQPIDRAEKPL